MRKLSPVGGVGVLTDTEFVRSGARLPFVGVVAAATERRGVGVTFGEAPLVGAPFVGIACTGVF